MTSQPSPSAGSPKGRELARYRQLADYRPSYGDFVVKAGWFFTIRFGFVNDFNESTGEVSILWEGLPRLLLTMGESRQIDNTKTHKLSDIRDNRYAGWSVLKQTRGEAVWYI